ncbi:phage holin [Metabacillus fastidiosus]|uniref:phage holin n=1 Tax=Metabacillus fastidiosus TaxID=1458 RepID=UPI002E2445C8|nr:phage holin [Metabacillus fastidiosus]MED4531516.1 phage holin [Metabacillus fastidiosus]
MINWKVRLKNTKWIIGFVSQLLIIVQMAAVGLHQTGAIDFVWTENINVWVLGFTNAVLIALSMLGFVQDPTTKGYSDSEQAKSYTEPK